MTSVMRHAEILLGRVYGSHGVSTGSAAALLFAGVLAFATTGAVAGSAQPLGSVSDSLIADLPQESQRTMDVVVRLKADIARAHHDSSGQGSLPAAGSELFTILSRFGVELRPQHPDSTDPELMTFFVVVGATGDNVNQLRQALADLDAVDGVYIKPAPSMP